MSTAKKFQPSQLNERQQFEEREQNRKYENDDGNKNVPRGY
jgi:hypothetical protein